jgi:hypothetical protein
MSAITPFAAAFPDGPGGDACEGGSNDERASLRNAVHAIGASPSMIAVSASAVCSSIALWPALVLT